MSCCSQQQLEKHSPRLFQIVTPQFSRFFIVATSKQHSSVYQKGPFSLSVDPKDTLSSQYDGSTPRKSLVCLVPRGEACRLWWISVTLHQLVTFAIQANVICMCYSLFDRDSSPSPQPRFLKILKIIPMVTSTCIPTELLTFGSRHYST